ncbi:MAG: electron transport complex subunit RsxE [Actinobacteria bacterium]|nr:electron transport complex subunit RsxE [Actinomycetota bacterium]
MFTQLWHDIKNGIVAENPLLRLMIGLCSALAVSNKFENGIFMGIAFTFVLFFSNIIISSIRRITPDNIRIPVFIVIIASFVTIIDLVMRAYFPSVYDRLGVWIPLIVVNCIILGRAEAFASKNTILRSAADGIGMGIGYTLVLLIMGFIRELLGTGKLIAFDKVLISLGPVFEPPRIMVMFPGAFLTFGFLIAILNKIQGKEGH